MALPYLLFSPPHPRSRGDAALPTPSRQPLLGGEEFNYSEVVRAMLRLSGRKIHGAHLPGELGSVWGDLWR